MNIIRTTTILLALCPWSHLFSQSAPILVSPDITGAAQITFPTEVGLIYQVEISENLEPSDFQNATHALQGTGGEVTVLFSLNGLPSAFARYRNDGDPLNLEQIPLQAATDLEMVLGWGDHAEEGYLSSFTEADPVFMSSVAGSISQTQVSNWETAFSWGNHALAGYLDSSIVSLNSSNRVLRTNGAGELVQGSITDNGGSVSMAALQVTGAITANSINADVNISVSGTIDVGNDISVLDDLTVGDRLRIGIVDLEFDSGFDALMVDESIFPDSDSRFDLGSSSRAWDELHVDEAFVDGISISSDRRLKENIQELEVGLLEVLELEPVSYSLKTDSDSSVRIGFIAQDLNEIIPEVVSAPSNPEEMYSVRYTDLIPVLVKALQEQESRIAELERAIGIVQE